MTSYHRVLKLFDRSVKDYSLECNCEIHPWNVSINGKNWDGKIRLIGYLDVFFLISYTGDSLFQDGVIIYKEDDAIREILNDAHVDPKNIGLKQINDGRTKSTLDDDKNRPEPTRRESERKNEDPKYFTFVSDDLAYVVTSLGHRIGLWAEHDPSCLESCEVRIRKIPDNAWKREIKRGITQHSLAQLGEDILRLGLVSHAVLIKELTRRFLLGGITSSMVRSYGDGLGR